MKRVSKTWLESDKFTINKTCKVNNIYSYKIIPHKLEKKEENSHTAVVILVFFSFVNWFISIHRKTMLNIFPIKR